MQDTDRPLGLRDRKRQDTTRRITDAALALFLAKGLDAVTVEEIAEAAGISRRSFFHYFPSKDDILLSLQSGLGQMLAEGLERQPPDQRPLAALRAVMLHLAARYPAEETMALDRLMRSSPSVMARKQASYVEHERVVFAALCRKWPEPGRVAALRMVAMLAIGALRLSLETLGRENGKRPLPVILTEAFEALETGL